MFFLKKIWGKIKRLFTKKVPTTDKIISESKATLNEIISIDEIYNRIGEAIDDNEKAELIKKVAKYNTAKAIIDFVKNEELLVLKNKKGKKKLLLKKKKI